MPDRIDKSATAGHSLSATPVTATPVKSLAGWQLDFFGSRVQGVFKFNACGWTNPQRRIREIAGIQKEQDAAGIYML